MSDSLYQRILAHYTIYEGEVWHLHIFESDGKTIRHYPATQETAHTLFIEGIAIICRTVRNDILETLDAYTQVIPKYGMLYCAKKISEITLLGNDKTPFVIYMAKYPTFKLTHF